MSRPAGSAFVLPTRRARVPDRRAVMAREAPPPLAASFNVRQRCLHRPARGAPFQASVMRKVNTWRPGRIYSPEWLFRHHRPAMSETIRPSDPRKVPLTRRFGQRPIFFPVRAANRRKSPRPRRRASCEIHWPAQYRTTKASQSSENRHGRNPPVRCGQTGRSHLPKYASESSAKYSAALSSAYARNFPPLM
jgi:hypothetical protein